MNHMHVVSEYTFAEFMNAWNLATTKRFTMPDGVLVKGGSVRLQTIMNNPQCVECGAVPNVARFEYSTLPEQAHVNIYYVEEGKKDLLFTKDHIVPKSWGGSGSVENMQTMCEKCNGKKANSFAGTQDKKMNMQRPIQAV